MSDYKIGTVEAIAILSIIMANKIILNLPKTIISSTGTSACLNTIYIIFLALIFVLVITKLLQSFNGLDILDISKYLGGTFLQSIVSVANILLLYFIICFILKHFSNTLKTIYFPQSPIIFILLFFIIAASYSNKFGIKAIAKVTMFVFPLAMTGLIILLLSPATDFEIRRLFPILGYGLKETFLDGTLNLFALSGIGYIFLLPSLLKEKTHLNRIALISLGISGFFLLLSTFCLLLVFSFVIDTNESTLLYVLTMFMRHGNLIHGINTLFVLIWILSIMSYISITFSFILFILQKTLSLKDTTSSNYSIFSLILGTVLILEQFTNFSSTLEQKLHYAILVFVFIIEPLILVLAKIKLSLSRSKEDCYRAKGMFMKKTLKTLTIILTLATLLFNLAGCYDATGVEELAYVVAIGLDISDSNELELTLQIATEENGSSGESSSSSTQSKQANVTSVKCTSINSGLSLINNHISKQTNLSHCQVIIISEKLAKRGISEYVDTLLNNVELRNDCSVIISKCSAKDYINNVKPSLETLVARFYESTLQSAKYTGYTVNISLAEFYSKMKDSTCEPYAILGNISSKDEKNTELSLNYDNTAGENPIQDDDVIDNFGIAVFKDDVLVGELTGLDSICHVMVINQLEECTLSIPNPFEKDKYLDLLLTSEKNTQCNISINDNSLLISVDIYLDAKGLSLDEHTKYDSEESLNLIKKSAIAYIQNQVNDYLYKTAKQYNSDICGFGKYAISKYLTIDDWNSSNWLDNYKNASFDVRVHLNMESGSLFSKS